MKQTGKVLTSEEVMENRSSKYKFIDMEENKIIEFVREFNVGLEKSNYYNLLQYGTDGFSEGISLSEISLWNDNYSYEHYRTLSLSGLVKQLTELYEDSNL